MSSTTIIISVVTTVITMLLGLIFIRNKAGAIVASLIAGAVTAFVLYFWVTDLPMNFVRHWLDLSVPVLTAAVIGTILLAAAASFSEYPSGNAGAPVLSAILVIVILVGFVLGDWTINPRGEQPFCKERETNALVDSFDLTLEPQSFQLPNVDPNKSIVVDSAMALTAASSQFGQYSSYLKLGSAQHVEADHRSYIVINMKPLKLATFNSHGGTIPGYYLVDSTNSSVAAPLQPIQMYIVPGLEASKDILPLTVGHDLRRLVYDKVLAPMHVEALDLETLELDDDLKPHYTALLVQPAEGTMGYKAVGFLDVDPTINPDNTDSWYKVYPIVGNKNPFGRITYDTSAVPSWVNNVFPEEFFHWWIEEWASYKNHTVCIWNGGNEGRYEIDRVEDKLLADGHRIYMYSLTSLNPDSAMTHLFYADPRTGKVRGYETKDASAMANLEYVEGNFRQASKKLGNTTDGFTPTETELTQWGGYDVITTVFRLDRASEKNEVTSSVYQGFGVVWASQSALSNGSSYLVANTPQEAYQLFLQFIANQKAGTSNRGAVVEQVVIKGTIVAVGQPYYTGTFSNISFMLRDETDGKVYRFFTQANQETTLLAVGQIVIVKATTVDVNAFNVVGQLENLSLQNPQ